MLVPGSQATQGIPGSQGTQGVDSLSVRTRAVAQFLKRECSISSTSEDVTGDLSLDKILEGKTRKLCARMFYETLVLDGLLSDYEAASHGPAKWQKLTMFLQKRFANCLYFLLFN
ncbi:hypothetical protein TB2_019285 [Malus domestica]